MRLLLDAHVSGRRIASALREQHDVRAADEERELDGWDDERVLTLATEQGRIMVTFNVKDFVRITTEWAAAGKSHAGCLLIFGIDHAEFGVIPRAIAHALSSRPEQAAWVDYTAWGVRSATTWGDRSARRAASVRKLSQISRTEMGRGRPASRAG